MLKTPKIIASLLGVLPLCIQAEDCCLPAYQPGTPLCEDEVCAMYPAFAGIKLQCGFNTFGYADFLYWTPVTSRNYVATTFEGTPLGTIQKERFHKCGLRPGFRIGVGMGMPDADDNWVASIEYLWYHHDFTKNFSISAPATITNSFDQLTNPIYRTIKDRFNINYDLVSVKLGRPNYLGRNMIFNPYVSIKWFRKSNRTSQHLTQALTGLVDRQHTRISYTSLGLGSGMVTDWLFCWGLRLIGKIEFNFLATYSRKNREILEPANAPKRVSSNPLRHVDVVTDSALGLGWGKYYCCERYHVDLSAAFEVFADSSDMDFNSFMFTKGTAVLYGLTVSGRFDF